MEGSAPLEKGVPSTLAAMACGYFSGAQVGGFSPLEGECTGPWLQLLAELPMAPRLEGFPTQDGGVPSNWLTWSVELP